METPLKLLLANKLRDEGFVVREGEFDMGCHTLKIEEGKVKARFYVDNSDKPLVVGKGSIVNDLVDEGLRLFRKPEPIYEARAACLDLFMIWIVPVKSDDDILIGHRVLIGVRKFQFEDRANRVSGMIRQWFDVIPEVTLLNG